MGAGARVGAGAKMRAETRAGAGTGALISIIALKILCKSSSEYLRTLVAIRALAIRGFGPKCLAGWLDNLSPNSGGGEELGRATKGASEGRLWWEHSRP